MERTEQAIQGFKEQSNYKHLLVNVLRLLFFQVLTSSWFVNQESVSTGNKTVAKATQSSSQRNREEMS